MSSQGRGYGPVADGIGVLFWAAAVAGFTFPFWGWAVGVAVGFLLGF